MTTKQQLIERYKVQQRKGVTMAGLPKQALSAAGFNESQPRDELGRWRETGKGGEIDKPLVASSGSSQESCAG